MICVAVLLRHVLTLCLTSTTISFSCCLPASRFLQEVLVAVSPMLLLLPFFRVVQLPLLLIIVPVVEVDVVELLVPVLLLRTGVLLRQGWLFPTQSLA